MLCHSLKESLSAEFLFFQAGERMPGRNVDLGLTFEAVDGALQSDGQPMEAEWPYQTTTPIPWIPPSVTKLWYGALIDSRSTVVQIGKALRAHQPVVLGIQLTSEFYAPISKPYIISAKGSGFGGHAVLAVGLGTDPIIGPVLLVRNSWGNRWGFNGHAWLARSYLDDKLIGMRTLEPAGTT